MVLSWQSRISEVAKSPAASEIWDRTLAAAIAGQIDPAIRAAGTTPLPPDLRVQECSIASDKFDYTMQVFLFIVCMGSLLLKWHFEVPQRNLFIFFMDISKQMVGAGVLHFINMVQAIVLEARGVGDTDPCGWYWITFLVDCTLGLLITLTYLKVSEKIFGYKTGLYGDASDSSVDWQQNPDYSTWVGQMLVWTGITCMAKATVMVIIFCRLLFWGDVGEWGTTWISNTQWRLLYVMVITPGIMDTVYFWITDEFIKYTKPPDADLSALKLEHSNSNLVLENSTRPPSSARALGGETSAAP